MAKRCLYCGRYFTPDYRIKERQKSCNSVLCRFTGHYETYVKPWRKRMIKDAIAPSKRLQKLILMIPGETLGMIKDEITVKRVGVRTFAAHGYG